MIQAAIQRSSVAALAGLAVNYAASFAFGWQLGTEAIAEWIMAETPSSWAVPVLDSLGAWAKPWAMTGGLATLGFLLFLLALLTPRFTAWLAAPPIAFFAYQVFEWHSIAGQFSFWLPALIVLTQAAAVPFNARRRQLLTSAAMASGTVAVAGESYLRDQSLARHATAPVALDSFTPPVSTFAPNLVRPAITPVGQFYVMSKNSVDPAPDPRRWRLRVTFENRTLAEYSYRELLALPRTTRYQTLRCVSNTLKSDLMSTAHWSGLHLRQLLPPGDAPRDAVELAVLGVDGHGDSFQVPYAFDDEFLLALGMNGRTLNRNHGFPIRLLAPRYYGFKNIKWISELRFVRHPYYGTWPKRGFSKQPLVHTCSHIDRFRREQDRINVGGVSFAGHRGIQRVEVRANSGPWTPATLEPALSPYTWTRWHAALPGDTKIIEARAMDGTGAWQRATEKPQFPDGVAGPTIREIA